jgi:hypothetical protein
MMIVDGLTKVLELKDFTIFRKLIVGEEAEGQHKSTSRH